MVTTIKRPVPYPVRPSFAIFDIRVLWRSAPSPGRQSARMSKIANDGLTGSAGKGWFIAVPIWQQWASNGWKEFVKKEFFVEDDYPVYLRRILFLWLFSIRNSEDVLSSPSSISHALCCVPASSRSVVKTIISYALTHAQHRLLRTISPCRPILSG